MAALDFPASPTNDQVFVAPNGVIYVFTTTPAPGYWKSAGIGAPLIFTGTTTPSTPVANQLWFYNDGTTGGGQLFLYYDDGAGAAQWIPASPGTGSGGVLQTVSFQTGAMVVASTVIPGDDTIPQITEGDEYMTLAITPRSATSKLIIDVIWNGANGAGAGQMIVALFQGSTANALAVASAYQPTASAPNNIKLTHTMVSGATSATTFRVRAGFAAAGNTTFNGNAGNRSFGGAMASSIVIQEVV